MTRRRFIQICAAAAAANLCGQRVRAREAAWRGRALGAEVSIILSGGTEPAARAVLAEVPELLVRIERQFSLHDPASALSRLNRDGYLAAPEADFDDLLDLCDRLHSATGGLFDPTVQPLWEALATGGDVAGARSLIGWERVRVAGGLVRIGPEQRLTLNGIAQGYATDLVRARLAAAGFDAALVNVGEFAALGGPWRIGIEDPEFGLLAERRLIGRAIATSSARGTLVGGVSHILHPHGGNVRWATISVEADSAALADGLSTALVLAGPESLLPIARALPGVRRIVTVDPAGDLATVDLDG